jgi:hypothetical protein
MKTSLGDDCVVIHLDYDAVKEVVQIVSSCRDDYERQKLSTGERDKNFTLRFHDRCICYFATRISCGFPSLRGPAALPHCLRF